MRQRLLNYWLIVTISFGWMIGFTATAQAQTIAFTGATVETMAEAGRIEDATLVVRDGIIVEVGTDVEIPVDARVVPMDGKTITPGWIDPYFVFSGAPSGSISRTSAGSLIQIGEYFYPYRTDLMPAVRSGITTANLVTSGRGISGLAYLYPDPDPEMLFQETGLLFAQITNQTVSLNIFRDGLRPQRNQGQGAGGGQQGGAAQRSGTRGTSLIELADNNLESNGLSQDDDLWQEMWQDDDDPPADEDAEEDSADDGRRGPAELWEAVRQGKQSFIMNVNNAATVAHVLNILKEHDEAKLAIVASGSNVYESLDQLAKHRDRLTIVMEPRIDTTPFSQDKVNVPRLVAEREVPLVLSLSLNSGQLRAMQDDPLFPIAMLVKAGLDREIALRALTLTPAKLLGIEETHGSLEEGKVANLLVFSDDPLATGSRLEQVILKGKVIHEN